MVTDSQTNKHTDRGDYNRQYTAPQLSSVINTHTHTHIHVNSSDIKGAPTEVIVIKKVKTNVNVI